MPLLHSVLSKLHEIPIYAYVVMIVVSLVFWTALAILFQKRPLWKWLNTALLILSVVLIISITLAFRQVSNQSYSLTPFSTFELAKKYPDVYQQLMLNGMLYMPIGLTMPFVLSGCIKYPVIVTIVFALFLSTGTELLQYFFMRGYAEIDDVICNTIGAIYGVSSYAVSVILDRKRKKGVLRKYEE